MSNRMFLIAKHIQSPRNPMDLSEGYKTDEIFAVTKNVKSREFSEASIIIDVAQQKIVKNRFTERTFDELFAYFMTHYKDQINKWLNAQIEK